MVKKIIITLLASWIAVAQANTVTSEKELIAEFEKSFNNEISCNQDFVGCVQEKKRAKEKYLAKNNHRIKRPVKSDAQLKQEIMSQYNHSKKQREVVTREGNSFNQVIIKEAPKKGLDQQLAEGLMNAVSTIMGVEKLQNQIEQNSERSTQRMNESMRKISEKGNLCRYWIENQNKHPQGSQHKEQACK